MSDTKKTSPETVRVGDNEYKIDDLGDKSKTLLTMINKIDHEISEASYELTKLEAARVEFIKSLKKELVDEVPVSELDKVPEEVKNMMTPEMKEELKKAAQAK